MYSATYKQKKVIKLAPDSYVLINGKTNVEICDLCHGQLNLSDHLINLTTNLSTLGTIGSASFTIAMPKHGHAGNYMVRGGRVHGISLMHEVEINIKSRFPDAKGVHHYYKSFWGVITGITESYSAGTQEISVTCESMTKWLQLMKTNMHPSNQAFLDDNMNIDATSTMYTGKTFGAKNPYEIVYMMMNITYSNIVIPDGIQPDKLTIEDTFGGDNGKPQSTDKRVPILNPIDVNLVAAWTEIFKKMKTSLKMYGVTDKDITVESGKINDGEIAQPFSVTNQPHLAIIINYNYRELMHFRPFNKSDDRQSFSTIHNNYKSNLIIIEEVKIFSGFEFYLDTTGNFIFKPPFWNLDVKQNKTYVIEDTEILNWSWSESESEVITRVEVNGSIYQQANFDSYWSPRGVYTNYVLAQQFGLKVETITMRFFNTPELCYYHAISELDRHNASRFKGSMTIIGRPELRLGMPIYIVSRDCYAYIENIAHNFSFGGPFTTSLTLSAVRRKYSSRTSNTLTNEGENQLKKIDSVSGEYFLIQDLTIPLSNYDSRLLAQNKNALQVKSASDLKENQTKLTDPNTTKEQSIALQAYGEAIRKETNGPLMTNQAGTYRPYHVSTERAQEVAKDFLKAKATGTPLDYLDILAKAIPLSDYAGYELVGIYENGKSLYLDSNNNLKTRDSNVLSASKVVTLNTASNIDINLAANAVANMNPILDQTGKPQAVSLASEVTAEDNLAGFLQYSATSLTEIAPYAGRDFKKCSCHNPGLEKIRTKPVSPEKPPLMSAAGKRTN